jgi:hypothetical protein
MDGRMRALPRWAWIALFSPVLFTPAQEPSTGPAKGPLKVSARNPRYFADPTGRAVYLTGSHTWNSLQDMATVYPPPVFDFNAYLDFLERHHHNFIRLWRWELLSWNTAANQEKESRIHFASPHPWPRTGPGTALDGKPKFNIETFDDAYFQRLRARVAAAQARGIYVSIMLFEGWGLRFVPEGWKAHPFHASNNVNGLDKELKADMPGIQLFTLTAPKVVALQEAYVRLVIDTVNDLDNVLYEISNESDFSTTEWQYHFIRFIKAYEATQAKQHPVGMTSIGYGVDDLDRLRASPADWISPNPDRLDYRNAPPAASGDKVVLLDTDHLWGVGGDVAWVWKSFLRGLNPLFMDTYRREILDRGDEADWERVRQAMGSARRLADRLDLAELRPHPELAGGGYCLAALGQDYVVYLPAAVGSFSLQLVPGTYHSEWSDPVTGALRKSGDLTASAAPERFAVPSPGEVVLWLRIKPSP